MLLTGALCILYVLLAVGFSGPGDPASTPSFKYDVSQIAPGEVRQILWQDRPVIILHRTEDQIQALKNKNSALRDPASLQSRQPVELNNYHRSVKPAWFVAIAVGTDMGCGLEYLEEPVTQQRPEQSALKGAFRDQCRGSLYDLAGRVLSGQSAEKNLAVPAYTWADEQTLWLGGKE